ncbi:class II aldolase/adducin family protein [Jannaschia sp. CCS1]|uniref:class II aldolase/adducin family protein n=1 Tax=Jannaschia sp. (strain CCS1) TaxID=290400 RepID=UPI000053B816|nr:class II aldolase/adducin family protein [Jannaschia sp. CCS1]ABD53790.1 class II aldolase/adducin-like protein [Jannaschia sp. CCS1]
MPDPYYASVDDLKQELVHGFRAMALNDLGLGLLAHLTARMPGADTYWTYQIGQSVEEVRLSDLREVGFDAKAVDGTSPINPSILCHGDVYRARPDITCILHHHSKASIALGAIGANLAPIDRNSGRWHDEINIVEDFDAPEIANQGTSMVDALGSGKALILKHHGALVTGRNIRETVVAAAELDRAMEVQLMAMGAGTPAEIPQAEIDDCKKFLASDMFADGTWNWYMRTMARRGLLDGASE